MSRPQPNMIEIDFASFDKHGVGLDMTANYMIMYAGRFYIGIFSTVWFGMHFLSGQNMFPYDPPGTNMSRYQRIWKFENSSEIADEAEMEYAITSREYCIKHGMTSNGQRIDESAPMEAFLYSPLKEAMPKIEDEE